MAKIAKKWSLLFDQPSIIKPIFSGKSFFNFILNISVNFSAYDISVFDDIDSNFVYFFVSSLSTKLKLYMSEKIQPSQE